MLGKFTKNLTGLVFMEIKGNGIRPVIYLGENGAFLFVFLFFFGCLHQTTMPLPT